MNIIITLILTITSGLIGGFTSYYFAEKTENYKFELLKQEQASKIADLFAYWIKYDDSTFKELDDESQKDYYHNLNKLSWELAIWISDESVVKEIMFRLGNDKKAKDIRILILEARKLLQKKENKYLKPKDIVYFSKKK